MKKLIIYKNEYEINYPETMNNLEEMVGGDYVKMLPVHPTSITHNSIEVTETPYHVILYELSDLYIVDTVLPDEIPDECNGDGAGGGQMFFLSDDYNDAYQLWSDDASKFEMIFGNKCVW